jgi:hypothetical protein
VGVIKNEIDRNGDVQLYVEVLSESKSRINLAVTQGLERVKAHISNALESEMSQHNTKKFYLYRYKKPYESSIDLANPSH